MTTITTAQAESIITAAFILDVLTGNGGSAPTDDMFNQYTDLLVEAEKNVPTNILRAAYLAISKRPYDTPRSRAAFAWVRAQNVTD